MLSENEQQWLRKASEAELVKYIDDFNHIDAPERRAAMQILEDLHKRQAQEKIVQLTEVIRDASGSSKSLEDKLLRLNKILTVATVVGAVATVVMAFAALSQFKITP